RKANRVGCKSKFIAMNSIVSFQRVVESQTQKVLGIEVNFTAKISDTKTLTLSIDVANKKFDVTNKFTENDYLKGFNISDKLKKNNAIFWLKQEVYPDKQITLKAADNKAFSLPK